MKKNFFIITMLLGFFMSSSLWAQTAQEKKIYHRGGGINTFFQEGMFGYDIGFDIMKHWHFSIGGDWANYPGGYSSSSFNCNIGWSKRRVFNNWFLIQGRLLPYLGSLTMDDGIEEDSEFTYGVRADAQIGLKVFSRKDGGRVFLTGGYRIDAPEFETKNMFENGWWVVGISFVGDWSFD